VVKVRNVAYDKEPLQQVVLEEVTIWVVHEGSDSGVGVSDFSNKIISELLAVDVQIDEEDKGVNTHQFSSTIIDHIVTTIVYGKETLILEEVTETLLSNEVGKRSNQEEQ